MVAADTGGGVHCSGGRSHDWCVCLRYLQCNNPKTKEPKLSAAVRIVPEWVEYDNKIKQLLRDVQEQKDNDRATQTQSPMPEPSSSPEKTG